MTAIALAGTPVIAARPPDALAIDRGTISVAENRARPDGRRITIAYIRMRSTAARPGPPIVYLAGGPGGSGIGDMEAERFHPYRRWLASSDIIAFDQRGTGASSPSLDCPGGYVADASALVDRAHGLAAYRAAAARCAGYWRAKRVDLAAYTTEASADDVADLARALGLAKIRLFGASYGSHLGLTIIRRHPALVDRAVLGAIEGPDQTIKRPADGERQLQRIGTAMAADRETAKTLPDFRGFVGTLIARADRSPIAATRGDGSMIHITGFDLRLLLAAMIGRRSEIERLPALFGPATRADYTPLADAITKDVRRGDISAMGAVMDCASGASPARRTRIAAEAPGTLLGTTPDFPLPDWCPAWGVPALPAAFRAPVVSDVPIVLIAGDLDGQTPPANAIEVRRGFRHGRLFTVHRAGHDPSLFLSSPELFGAITRFMAGADTTDRRFIAPPLQFTSPIGKAAR